MGLISRLRAYFLAGVLVTAPISITLYLAFLFINFIDQSVGTLIPASGSPLGALPVTVPGLGVLITGESGVGKSELALELISRGHGLVADDVVEISHIGLGTLEARCPPMLKDFLEVRGLGMLNIRTIFGETAVRPKMRLKLIVQLAKSSSGGPEIERLPLEDLSEEILGVVIRKVVIPVAAGRNLAVLLEAAVRNHILRLRGIDSTAEFMARQSNAIQLDEDDEID